STIPPSGCSWVGAAREERPMRPSMVPLPLVLAAAFAAILLVRPPVAHGLSVPTPPPQKSGSASGSIIAGEPLGLSWFVLEVDAQSSEQSYGSGWVRNVTYSASGRSFFDADVT